MLHVTDTKIFAARAQEAGRQFTVYENTVSTQVNNAMVLPAYGKNIVMFDMSSYPGDFMRHCESCFPITKGMAGGFQAMAFGFGGSTATLPVQQVGAYKVTVVPTLGDLWRLDTAVFTISTEARDTLTKHYPQDYGFVVCAFSPTPKAMHAHPIAYFSDLLPGNKLFIPTRHEHGHGAIHGGWMFGGSGATNTAAFDHVIYTADSAIGASTDNQSSTRLDSIAWNALPIGRCRVLQKLTLEGFHPNEDVIIPLLPVFSTHTPSFLNLPPPAHTPEGVVLHTGIRCDGCGATQMRGIRYQCTVCSNFDLCEHCERLDIHDVSHPLIKHKRARPNPFAEEDFL
jgi:hypothetical protein